jgi:oligo-1,6-glucosidase
MDLEWMFSIIFKSINFPELPKEIVNKPVEIIKYGNGPRLHEYIQEMN